MPAAKDQALSSFQPCCGSFVSHATSNLVHNQGRWWHAAWGSTQSTAPMLISSQGLWGHATNTLLPGQDHSTGGGGGSAMPDRICAPPPHTHTHPCDLVFSLDGQQPLTGAKGCRPECSSGGQLGPVLGSQPRRDDSQQQPSLSLSHTKSSK